MRLVTLCAVFLTVAGAQTGQQRGQQAIDEAVAAMGGEKFLNMRGRIEYGRAYSFYNERLSGLSKARISVRYVPPSKPGALGIEERQAFGKNEDSGTIFSGGKGWQFSFRGARPLPDDLYERYRISTLHNVFYILRQRLKEPGMIFELKRTDVHENQPVHIVDITDSDNRTVTVYFHMSTRLPVRQVYFRRDPQTRDRIEEVTTFSKYREVDGVQWPYAVQRERNGEKIFEMYAESVNTDPKLPDSLFQVEGKLKVLPPAK